MITCFILSAGSQRRFKSGAIKQLQVIFGECLMDRQLRQMAENGINPTVVSWRNEILSKHPVVLNTESATPCILTTLLRTSTLWEKRNLVLLGDVYFHDRMVNSLVTESRPIRFWMSGSEIYALSFDESEAENIIAACNYCIGQGCEPRMWHLWRRLSGMNIHSHAGFHINEMSGELLTEDDAFDCDSEMDKPCSAPS